MYKSINKQIYINDVSIFHMMRLCQSLIWLELNYEIFYSNCVGMGIYNPVNIDGFNLDIYNS